LPRLLIFLLVLSTGTLWAQVTPTFIKGKVIDASTGEGLPFVNVFFKGTQSGTTTDFEGFYTLKSQNPKDSLVASYIGYLPSYRKVALGKEQTINFQLQPDSRSLDEVVIIAGENPALRIIRGAIENNRLNNKNGLKAYQFEAYTKVEVDIDNISPKFKDRKIFKNISGLFDSLRMIQGEDGKPILPIFMSESLSEYYFRANPKAAKEVIIKTNVSGVGFGDGDIVSQLIGSTFQEYNFYDNYVSLFNKNFATPLNSSINYYYEYILQDSGYIGNNYCYKIDVRPRRPQDLAFNGSIWITSNEFALKQLDLSIGKQANLNFIEKIKIQQTLVRTDSSQWIPDKTRILVDVEDLSDSWAGMIAKFYTSNKNVAINRPMDNRFYEQEIVVGEAATLKETGYWEEHRHDSLTNTEKSVYNMIDSIKEIPTIKSYVEVVNIIYNGFKKVGPVDIGTYLWVYSNNNIEGNRLRLGIKTNGDFSKKWILGGYLAYGWGDNRYKYNASVSRILDRKKWTVAGAELRYDIDQVGLISEDLTTSPLFLAFTRWGTLNRPFYSSDYSFHFSREVKKGLTTKIKFRRRGFEALYPFAFRTRADEPTSINGSGNFTASEVIFETRYGRDELFLQTDRNERVSLGARKWPIFTIRYILGIDGLAGGQFNYHKFMVGMSHTVNTGLTGRGIYEIKAGYIPSTLPYPLLQVHLGNQSPFYNSLAFNLMNLFEFVSDKYVSFRYTQKFDGFLLNSIPVIKRLKWRLFATGTGVYGGISSANRNLTASVDNEGNTVLPFNTFSGLPYAEVSYGVENVLRLFRIEFIHRLSYLDNPNANRFGVKVAVEFQL
jgi:hypothetical protein